MLLPKNLGCERFVFNWIKGPKIEVLKNTLCPNLSPSLFPADTQQTHPRHLPDTLKTTSRHTKDIVQTLSTLQTPSRHPQDTSRHPPDTHQTPSRQFPYTLQTPTRQSPKIRHVGSFLLLKARWGLVLPSFLLPSCFWENKVNSYSNQLKLS